MAPPRRKVLATAEETMFPPDEFADTHQIARAIKATGNNIYLIELPDKKQMLAELPARFRSTFWIKRGSFVVVDTSTSEERDNKIGGEIINIVRDEKAWRKAPFWYDFTKSAHGKQIVQDANISLLKGRKNSPSRQLSPPIPTVTRKNLGLARCLPRMKNPTPD
jgi:probable RNA-binding protein EIF1AD